MLPAKNKYSTMSADEKLAFSAGNIVSSYRQPIFTELRRKKSTEAVEKLMWEHLEKQLRQNHPDATNHDAVLHDAKSRLHTMVEDIKKELG